MNGSVTEASWKESAEEIRGPLCQEAGSRSWRPIGTFERIDEAVCRNGSVIG